MEAFGDSIVLGKAPHGNDLLRPTVQSLAELDQVRKHGLVQIGDGAKEAWHQTLALLTCLVFVQQQVEKLAMTAIEFPPMQKGASFNLDAVKAKIEAARAAVRRSFSRP